MPELTTEEIQKLKLDTVNRIGEPREVNLKKFYNRSNEIGILEQAYKDKPSLILLNGPRNVGKTELTKQFIQNKPHLYFSVNNFTDKLNRRNFLENLKLNYGLKVNHLKEIPNWEDLIKLYVKKPDNQKKILVIDNFDLLLQNNPEKLKEFVKIWNNVLKPNNVMTILVFPNNSILYRLLRQSNPLLKSSDFRLQLNPMNFLDMQKVFPRKSTSELISLFNITGGFPLYWTQFEDQKNVKDQIKKAVNLMFDQESIFFELPLNLLEKDITNISIYTTILYYLSQGIDSVNELNSITKLKKSEIEDVLEVLEQLGYVDKAVSINKRRKTIKNSRFYIKNPFFNFWFKYIYPNSSTLNQNHLIDIILKDYPNFIEEIFSRLAEEFLLINIEKEIFNFEPTKVGKFWNEDFEIPLVAIDNKNKKILMADTQYSLKNYGINEFKDFIIAAQEVKDLRKYKNYQKIFALFSANTPSEELIQYALNNEDIVLFTGKTMIGGK